MQYSPGDIIVYGPTLAGRGTSNQSKATIGLALGLDIPLEALEDESVMGQDLIIDDDSSSVFEADIIEQVDALVASPPLLGTRRSPWRPASFFADNSSLRTPSPSLRAWAPAAAPTLAIPAPAAPSLPTTPASPEPYTFPTSTAVSEGLNLLAMTDDELAEYEDELEAEFEYGDLGLGLGLAGWDSEDLITVIPGLPSPTAPRGPAGLGYGFAGFDDEELITVVPARPTISHTHTHTRAMSQSPSPSLSPAYTGLGYGLALDGDDLIVDELDGALSPGLSPLPAYYDLIMGMGLDRLHSPSVDDDNVSTPEDTDMDMDESPASPTVTTTTTHNHDTIAPRAFRRAAYGLGLFHVNDDLDGADTITRPASRRGFVTIPLSPPSPLAGSNSPFWGTYASAVHDEEQLRRDQRRSLLSRLPIIEETIYETVEL